MLAIYITLCAIVAVATAQILYWKLVITRADVACDDLPDMHWLLEPVTSCIGPEADDSDPVLGGEPVPARV